MKSRGDHDDSDRIDPDLLGAMGDVGLRLPVNESEVAKSEAWVKEQSIELPSKLEHPADPPSKGSLFDSSRADARRYAELERIAREEGERWRAEIEAHERGKLEWLHHEWVDDDR